MDEHIRGHQEQVHFVLFVAGESPRSKRARESINRMFEARGIDLRQIEIVDALTESSRVLAHRIVAVPTLMTTDGSSHRWLYVDLPDEESLGRWLDEVLGCGVDSATP